MVTKQALWQHAGYTPGCNAAYSECKMTVSLPLLPHGLLLTGSFESACWVRAERDLNMLTLLSAALSCVGVTGRSNVYIVLIQIYCLPQAPCWMVSI